MALVTADSVGILVAEAALEGREIVEVSMTELDSDGMFEVVLEVVLEVVELCDP